MSHFFAYMARMRYIIRWGLMRNTREENIAEHSLQTAMIAHSLALIRNRMGGEVNAEHVMALAVYHEASEVITGDLATPIKYFNPGIRDAYKGIEKIASARLLGMLPKDAQDDYCRYLVPDASDEAEWKLVKAADRICAYLKCVEELKAGNGEFEKAKLTIKKSIDELELPEVDEFMRTYVPSFSLTLDELN